jgi:outer membrane protein assembly factor BamB
LRASDLSFVASWQVPQSQHVTDGDFGSTPTLFQATIGNHLRQMLGLENKNGLYYAFDRTNIAAGPLWKAQVACRTCFTGEINISSSAFDGKTLYVAATTTTIKGTKCLGSLRGVDPASGTFLWQDCFQNPVLSSVMAVPGVVVIGEGPSIIVANATNGKRLFTFTDSSQHSAFWGSAAIINGQLYQGNMDGLLYAFGP